MGLKVTWGLRLTLLPGPDGSREFPGLPQVPKWETLPSVTGPGGFGDSVPMATAGGALFMGSPSLDSAPLPSPSMSLEAWP